MLKDLLSLSLRLIFFFFDFCVLLTSTVGSHASYSLFSGKSKISVSPLSDLVYLPCFIAYMALSILSYKILSFWIWF